MTDTGKSNPQLIAELTALRQRVAEMEAAAVKREQTEQALRERNEIFQRIYAESPIALEIYDSKGRLIDANRACLDLFGVSSTEEVAGFSLFEDPNLPEGAEERLRNDNPVQYEMTFDFDKVRQHDLYETTKTGIIYLNAQITPLGLGDGKATGYLVQVQDISKRKQVEIELKESQINFNALLNNSTDHILISDHEGKSVVFNTAYAQIMKEAIGLDMQSGIIPHKLVQDENFVKWWDNLHQRVLGGESFRVEFSYPMPERGVRHFEFSYHPIVTDGKVTGFSEISRDITERKQMEDALRASEERYRTLVLAIPHGIQESDKEGKVTFSNPAHHRIQGYAEGEIVGKHIWDFVATEAERDFLQNYYGQLLTEQPTPTPYQSLDRTKDGRLINTQIDWDYIRDAQGEVVGLVSIIGDITERKQMEDALRESEANLTAAQRMGQMGNWVNYLDRGELYWSDELFRIFDQERQIFTEQEFLSWIHPEDREHLRLAIRDYKRDKTHLDIDFRIVRPDGEQRTLHIYGEVICDEDGKVIKTMGTVQDITKRKRMEDALRESEANLTEAQRVGQIGNWVHYLDKNELHWSDELFNIFGRQQKELDTEENFDWIHPDDLEHLRKAIARYVTEKGRMEVEYRIIRSDGEVRLLRSHGEVICDADGKAIKTVGTVQDITEQKELEKQRLALSTERERSRILSKFIQDATHEFRTPLSLINMNTHILRQIMPKGMNQERLEAIELLVKQITGLVKDLVLMAKLDSDVPVEQMRLDTTRIMVQIEADMLHTLNPDEIEVVLKDTLPQPAYVVGNMQLLYRVFRNILENAVQHTDAEGTITVTAEQTEDQIVISIADTGEGMSEAVLARIFERFFRVDQAHTTSGFGLGLPIAQKVIELHGGTIEVESRPGKGSTFRISLPLFRVNVPAPTGRS
jgi:PAS domain S-box-containing protein